MKKSVALLIPLFILNSTNLRAQSFLPEVGKEDTIMVYAERRFCDFFNDEHSERRFIRINRTDLDSLYSLLADIKPYMLTGGPDEYKNAVFIEVRPKVGEKFGFFIGEDGCRIIVNGMPGHSFFLRSAYFHKKTKPYIKDFIERYKGLMPVRTELKRFDTLPLNAVVRAPMKCNLGIISKGEAFDIIFYALKDSSIVFPIKYSVYCRKKGKIHVLRRELDIWGSVPYAGTNSRGLLLVRNPSGVKVARGPITDAYIDGLIKSYIPSWAKLSNQERMRMLDDILVNQSVQ